MSEWTRQLNSLSRHVDYLATLPSVPKEPTERLLMLREQAELADVCVMAFLSGSYKPVSEKAVRNGTGLSESMNYSSLRRLEQAGKIMRIKTANAHYWKCA